MSSVRDKSKVVLFERAVFEKNMEKLTIKIEMTNIKPESMLSAWKIIDRCYNKMKDTCIKTQE